MPSRRRAEAVVLLVALLAFASECLGRLAVEGTSGLSCERASWLLGDCVTYRSIVRGIVDQHTLDQAVTGWDRELYVEGHHQKVALQDSSVSLTTDGRLVPKHPVIFAAALVLPYALLREWGLLAFNVVQSALLVLLVQRLSRLFAGEVAAGAAALAFLADGIVRNYSCNVSPDVFGAVLLVGGVVCVWTPGARVRVAALGGALLGLALWMRPLNAVGLVALLPRALEIARERRVSAERLAPFAAYALVAGGYLALDAAWFGSPFVTSYDRVVVMEDGVRKLAASSDCFHRPFLASLVPTLADPEHGLLGTAPHAPLLLLALASLARKGRARAAALAVIAFAPVVFLVRYDYWDTSHYGNRFFLLAAAATSPGTAWYVERLLRRARPARPGVA